MGGAEGGPEGPLCTGDLGSPSPFRWAALPLFVLINAVTYSARSQSTLQGCLAFSLADCGLSSLLSLTICPFSRGGCTHVPVSPSLATHGKL